MCAQRKGCDLCGKGAVKDILQFTFISIKKYRMETQKSCEKCIVSLAPILVCLVKSHITHLKDLFGDIAHAHLGIFGCTSEISVKSAILFIQSRDLGQISWISALIHILLCEPSRVFC